MVVKVMKENEFENTLKGKMLLVNISYFVLKEREICRLISLT